MTREGGCPRCGEQWREIGPDGGDCRAHGFVPRAEIEARRRGSDEGGAKPAGAPGRQVPEGGSRNPSQAERLLNLVDDGPAVLFTDQFGEPHVAIQGDGGVLLRLASKTFRWWMARLLYEAESRPPNAEATVSVSTPESLSSSDGLEPTESATNG